MCAWARGHVVKLLALLSCPSVAACNAGICFGQACILMLHDWESKQQVLAMSKRLPKYIPAQIDLWEEEEHHTHSIKTFES